MIKKNYNLQVKNEIIKDPNLSAEAFRLYLEFILIYGWQNNIAISSKKLRERLGWKDKRKLKKYLLELYEFGLIDTEYATLPKGSPLTLTPLNLVQINQGNFTQLPQQVLDWTSEIGEIGVRLLYLYCHYTNKTSPDKRDWRAFPSFETIRRVTGLAYDTIIKYNAILEEKKLIAIYREIVPPSDEQNYVKEKNNYIIKLENIINVPAKMTIDKQVKVSPSKLNREDSKNTLVSDKLVFEIPDVSDQGCEESFDMTLDLDLHERNQISEQPNIDKIESETSSFDSEFLKYISSDDVSKVEGIPLQYSELQSENSNSELITFDEPELYDEIPARVNNEYKQDNSMGLFEWLDNVEKALAETISEQDNVKVSVDKNANDITALVYQDDGGWEALMEQIESNYISAK